MQLRKHHFRHAITGLFVVLLIIILGCILLWNKPSIVVDAISKPLDYSPIPIPKVKMECFNDDTPVKWSYCINRVPNSTNKNLIYHFHGRRGDAYWWNDDTYYTGDLYREWQKTDTDAPTVISVSFGPLWMLKKTQLLDFFQNELVPQMESTLNTVIDNRLVVGESMGGVNAILVWLNSDLKFDRVASLCPPLPTISPEASYNEMMAYIRDTEVSWRRGLMMLFMGRYLYPNEDSWRDDSPLEVATSKDLSSSGALYLSCGKKDDWGCMAGSKQLVSVAKSSGATVHWHPMEGGHCDIDRPSLAKFLGDVDD